MHVLSILHVKQNLCTQGMHSKRLSLIQSRKKIIEKWNINVILQGRKNHIPETMDSKKVHKN